MCEHHGGRAFIREQRGGRGEPLLRFDRHSYDKVREGDLVWVRSTALPEFCAEVLPRIRARFALLSGDEDWSIPAHFARAGEILANKYVVCWFTQNLDAVDASDKMFPLPIGIDFHTISNRRKWGHPLATPQEQEAELQCLRQTMPANAERLPRVHADFHFNRQRAAVEALLRSNPNVDFLPAKLPRLKLWREKTGYAFVISPRGGGLDCHRTWESLALDNIVIVKRSPLDALYEGLPVVIVDRWEEITWSNLRRWHAQYAAAFAAPETQQRLTNRYWIDRVRAVLAERLAHTPAARPAIDRHGAGTASHPSPAADVPWGSAPGYSQHPSGKA
jgi:hypothetical protein